MPKQNMCVTIDENIHGWLRKKPEMMSRLVNGYLKDAMIEEMTNEDNRPQKICMSCESTYLTTRMFCPKHWCNGDLIYLSQWVAGGEEE
jgi:hypothetical protein